MARPEPAPRRTSRRTSTGPPLPPSAAVDGTRGRILVAGLELFADRGFHATSIRDVAAAAGVQSASLYSHFPSKESILAELVLLGHEEHHRRIVTAMLEAGADPTAQLAALVRAHVLVHAEFPMLGTVANYELHNLAPEVVAPALTLRSRSLAILEEVLDRGARDGVFVILHRHATTRAIAAIGVNVATWWPPANDDITAEELSDAYSDLALRMAGVVDRP
jgi:AcrR family transcriptional regulator